MRFTPNALFAVLVLPAIISSCKESIDIQSDTCYSVQQLLDSKNADVGCDEMADFEGNALCLTGVLEVSNDPHAPVLNFFLLDSTDHNRAVEIRLDSALAAEVIPLVQANRGKTAQAKGLMSGHSQPGNPDCRRTFSLALANAADLEVEDAIIPQPVDTIYLELAVWQLTAMVKDHTTTPVPDTLPVPITIKFETGKITGYNSCNDYGGTYLANGSLLSISDLYSTKKFCVDVAELETRYMQNLRNAQSFRISGETLEIDCGNMDILVYRLNWKKRKGE